MFISTFGHFCPCPMTCASESEAGSCFSSSKRFQLHRSSNELLIIHKAASINADTRSGTAAKWLATAEHVETDCYARSVSAISMHSWVNALH